MKTRGRRNVEHSTLNIEHSAFCMRPLALIACVARNGVIGRAGKLPWHLPDDLRHFKALTMGHCVIMGRVTYEALPGALAGRHIIVVSRHAALSGPELETAHSLDEALERAWARDALPFIAGGAQMYAQALPRVTIMYLTELEADADGDVCFPAWDPCEWHETARDHAPGMIFRTLRAPLRSRWGQA
jgi:dihydrofolate reductase